MDISANGAVIYGDSCNTATGGCEAVIWSRGQNEVATPSGSNVSVEPAVSLPGGGEPISVALTFDSVEAAGTTTVTASDRPTGGIPEAPPQFKVGEPPVYYDVDTTATFSGNVDLCFSWQENQFDNEGNIGLFHYADGAWQNVTTSLDLTANKVCGTVSSLSPFALFEMSYA